MKLRLDWQRKAIIIFASAIIVLSIVLTIFAIREAEREKLVREREIEEEQQRLTELVIDQVTKIIYEAEARIIRLLRGFEIQSSEKKLVEVCLKLEEEEEIIADIFIVNEKGDVNFPLVTPLYILPGQRIRVEESPIKLTADPLFKRAETAEFGAKNYSLAIESYQKLMNESSDSDSRALLMNNIARCYTKSGKHLNAIHAYQGLLKEYRWERSPDGIPLGLIAQYQIGNIYRERGEEIKAAETLLELYRGLLESRWQLSRNQFNYYRNRVKDLLQRYTVEIEDIAGRTSLMDIWEELERFEEGKLKRMMTIEDLAQKAVQLINTRRPTVDSSSQGFYHISEVLEKETLLISYTLIEDNSIFGIRLDSEILAKKLLPLLISELPIKEGWHVQIKDRDGSLVAGKDITGLINPTPQLTFSTGFDEDFPPWNVNILQTDPGSAVRQFNQRRNIYVITVAVVILALLLGGYLAIKSTAKELELAKLKSDFVSTVSHEFRTPLTSIRYLAEMLQRGRVQNEKRKQQYYETITSESERLSRLIENMLDFSKIEAGVKEYQFEETDLVELTRDVVSRFQKQIASEEFIIESEMSDKMPKISVDREAISRALFNLLDNAVKYSGKNRRIFFRARSDEEKIFLEVQDKGIGINVQDQTKIFDKFYRSDDIRNSRIEGSGIGLTLVSHIVNAHRGEVFLESEVGKGTKVTIKLPVNH